MHFLAFFSSELEGVLALKHLTTKVVSQNLQLDQPIEKALFKQFHKVTSDTVLGFVARILETDEFVAVVDSQYHCTAIITHLDLLHFISQGQEPLKNGN